MREEGKWCAFLQRHDDLKLAVHVGTSLVKRILLPLLIVVDILPEDVFSVLKECFHIRIFGQSERFAHLCTVDMHNRFTIPCIVKEYPTHQHLRGIITFIASFAIDFL